MPAAAQPRPHHLGPPVPGWHPYIEPDEQRLARIRAMQKDGQAERAQKLKAVARAADPELELLESLPQSRAEIGLLVRSRLNADLPILGWSISELSRRSGVTRSCIHEARKIGSAVTQKSAVRLLGALDEGVSHEA